jgi:cytochrome c biogenesis protein CcdA
MIFGTDSLLLGVAVALIWAAATMPYPISLLFQKGQTDNLSGLDFFESLT